MTLNLVVPCYNEEVLPETGTRLLAPLERFIDAGEMSEERRITFVDDRSRDRTRLIVAAPHAKHARYVGTKIWRKRGHRNIHKIEPLPANFFANNECDGVVVSQVGKWSLDERRKCR
jgi:hypothetical protein